MAEDSTRVTDIRYAKAFSGYNKGDGVDVYVVGIGPKDSGSLLKKMGTLERMALDKGIKNGRSRWNLCPEHGKAGQKSCHFLVLKS